MELGNYINVGLIGLSACLLLLLLSWLTKNFKLKHVWTIHLALGLLSGALIVLFLHLNLPDGAMRAFLVGDSDEFLWPFTIQTLMWFVFTITIWMLVAEGKLASLDATRNIANLDAHIDGRIEPVRYLIWLIPTLGFLGTIVGMSFAIRELSEADELLVALEEGLLQGVMTNLGTAFYTTILGLIMNAICFGVLSIFVFKHKQVLAARETK